MAGEFWIVFVLSITFEDMAYIFSNYGLKEKQMQYNENEKKCIRIIAKWFRENKDFVNRSEAMKELGVDSDRYDVLMKLMEHDGVVEGVQSSMGKGGYAIAFQPSVYAKKLAREFEEEDKRKYKEHAALQNAFTVFLEKEKGYPPETVWIGDKGKTPELSINEVGSQKPLVLIEFKLSNENMVIGNAALEVQQYKKTKSIDNCLAFIVSPSLAKSSKAFEIFEVLDDGWESLISINQFPAYEELGHKADTKTEASEDEEATSEKYSQSFYALSVE